MEIFPPLRLGIFSAINRTAEYCREEIIAQGQGVGANRFSYEDAIDLGDDGVGPIERRARTSVRKC
jgi:hypothetical protein